MIKINVKVDGKEVAEVIKERSDVKIRVKNIMKILTTPILTKVALDLKPIFDSGENKISLGKTFFAGIFGKK